MRKEIRITVGIFSVATIILAIAISYVHGITVGVLSQRPRIKELTEELYPGVIVDFGLWVHPLWYPLMSVAFIFGLCWIVIAVIALQEKRKELAQCSKQQD